MEANQKTIEMTETEKERWQLIGVIASAIGTAIAGYFAAKKWVHMLKGVGSKNAIMVSSWQEPISLPKVSKCRDTGCVFAQQYRDNWFDHLLLIQTCVTTELSISPADWQYSTISEKVIFIPSLTALYCSVRMEEGKDYRSKVLWRLQLAILLWVIRKRIEHSYAERLYDR